MFSLLVCFTFFCALRHSPFPQIVLIAIGPCHTATLPCTLAPNISRSSYFVKHRHLLLRCRAVCCRLLRSGLTFSFPFLLSNVPSCLPTLSHHLVTHFPFYRLVTSLWLIPIIYDSFLVARILGFPMTPFDSFWLIPNTGTSSISSDSFLVQVLVVLGSKNSASLLYIRVLVFYSWALSLTWFLIQFKLLLPLFLC